MGEFNYDLDRMKKALEGGTITVPPGLRGEELQKFLSGEDVCYLQRFLQSLPEKDRNKPISFSCPCSRCRPSM